MNISKKSWLTGVAGTALAIGLGGGLAAAQEQQPADDTVSVETVADDQPERREKTIVVTGSYVVGASEEGLLPVDVFSTDDLEQMGIDSPLEFMKSLPSVGTVLGDSNQFRAGAEQGVGSINLRNLGRERTLVLFNGRRTIPTPGDGAADTSLIPLFALSRIEVLKDGAASTYGSDAIAGVANFVTPTDFDGVEVSGDFTFIDGSDGDYKASVMFGKNFDAGNFLVGYGYQHRSELPTTERDFTQTSYADNPSGWSALSNPAIYTPTFSSGTIVGLGVDGALTGACEALGGLDGYFPTSATSGFPTCRYSYVPFDNLVEEEDHHQLYAQLDADVADDLAFHGEILWSKTDLDSLAYSPSYPPVQGPNGPGSTNAFYVPATNPGYADFLTQTFAPGSFAYFSSGANILLGRPFALGGNPLDPRGSGRGFAKAEGLRISAGLEKDFADDFRGEFYVTWLKSERDAASPDIVGGRLRDALMGLGGPDCTGTTPGANGCLYFNPFINAYPNNPNTGAVNPAYVAGNENSPDVINWIQSVSGAHGEETQLILDGVFSGETGMFGDRELRYAFGSQYRKSSFKNVPLNRFSDPDAVPCAVEGDFSCLDDPNDSNFPTGPFIFLGQYPRESLDQDVYALFAEGAMELTDTFEVTAAARFEDYGDPIGSTFNPKISARWQLADALALRGSVGTTFRAPLARDVTPGGPTGVAPFNVAGGAYKATQYQGNPELDPEEALTANIGALFNYGEFNFSVDYWTYDFEGAFVNLPFQAIASATIGPNDPTDGTALVDCSSPFTQYIIFDGGTCTQGTTIASDIARVNTQTVNGPDVKTSGFDIAAGYNRDMGSFDLSLGMNATYTLEYDVSDFLYDGLQFDTGYDAVGFANYNRDPGTMPEWKANGFVRADVGNFNAIYSFRYVSGVDDNQCPASAACTSTPEFGPTDFGRTVDSFLQHDVAVGYLTEVGGSEMTFRLGVENITDEDPSAARLPLSYDPYVGNPLGRIVKLSAKVKY